MLLERFLQVFILLELIVIFTTIKLGSEKIISKFEKKHSPYFYFFHVFILLTIKFGFLLPKKYLPYHIIMILLIFVHWSTNNEKCITAQIQNHLDGLNGSFTHRLFSDFGILIKSDFNISLFLSIISLSISVLRLTKWI